MKYIANPVEVDAFKIVSAKPPVVLTADNVGYLMLELEGGGVSTASPEMTSRMTPHPGDYLVIQADGYQYLNPKDVFERKYHAA